MATSVNGGGGWVWNTQLLILKYSNCFIVKELGIIPHSNSSNNQSLPVLRPCPKQEESDLLSFCHQSLKMVNSITRIMYEYDIKVINKLHLPNTLYIKDNLLFVFFLSFFLDPTYLWCQCKHIETEERNHSEVGGQIGKDRLIHIIKLCIV